MVDSGQYQASTGRLPQWYLDAPEIRDANRFYLRAFWDLSTERKFRRGPIPASRIRQFAREHGLAPDVSDLFSLVIREMDEEFLIFVSTEN